LSTLYSHRAAFTAIWAGKPDEAINIMDQSIDRLGNSSWFSAMKARALIVKGNYESARLEASKVPLDDITFGMTSVLVEAAAGNLEAANKLADDWLKAREYRDQFGIIMSTALGDRKQANEIASAIDKLPGGPGKLASNVTTCQCGAPFDLESTPNFKRQLEESGLPWPPDAPITYPAKDW
jgi:hypothetical protein